ncbi:MAG: hypothetical protein ABIO29_03900 [Sphingomicrobium sp.]
MPLAVQLLLLALALVAAALAGSRHARRHEHPRFVHHSIGFVIVAVVAAGSILFFGPQ